MTIREVLKLDAFHTRLKAKKSMTTTCHAAFALSTSQYSVASDLQQDEARCMLALNSQLCCLCQLLSTVAPTDVLQITQSVT